jgi:hypothetical protein
VIVLLPSFPKLNWFLALLEVKGAFPSIGLELDFLFTLSGFWNFFLENMLFDLLLEITTKKTFFTFV